MSDAVLESRRPSTDLALDEEMDAVAVLRVEERELCRMVESVHGAKRLETEVSFIYHQSIVREARDQSL